MGTDGRSSRPASGSAGWACQGRPEKHRLSSSRTVCRNVKVSGRRTSLSLEPGFWDGLGEICAREGKTLGELCSIVDERRRQATLAASTKVFVVSYFRAATPDATGFLPSKDGKETSLPLHAAFEAVG